MLLSLGDVLSRAGSEVEAKDAYRRAAAIAQERADPDRLARAAEGYGGRFLWPRAGTDAALVPLLETALATLGDGDSTARVRLMSRLSTALRDEPTRERRVSLADEAVAIARRLRDTPTLAYALDAHWVAVEGPYDVEERISRADELLELAQRIGDYERELEARDFRASTFWMLGDRAGVDVEFDAMNRLADALRQPAQRWLVSGYEVMFALLEGRLDEAEHLIAATLELGRRAYPWNAVKSHRFQLYVLRREQGRLAEIEETFRRVVHEYPDQQAFRCMLAHVYAEAGREREARAALAALLERDLSRTHVDEEWLLGLSVLADVCAYLRDAGSAARLYVLLLPFRRLNALATLEVAVGAVARPLGVLATTTGRFDDAEAHFQAAIEMERRMGARPGVAHAQHGLAAMLLARGAAGDRDRALALVRATVGAYEELGMGVRAARCAGLERGRGVAPRRD